MDGRGKCLVTLRPVVPGLRWHRGPWRGERQGRAPGASARGRDHRGGALVCETCRLVFEEAAEVSIDGSQQFVFGMAEITARVAMKLRRLPAGLRLRRVLLVFRDQKQMLIEQRCCHGPATCYAT